VKRLHWESWLLRVALLGTALFGALNHNQAGVTVAVEGLVVSLIPLLVQRLSKTHVPRALEFAFVLGMALQFISESTKLFELFTYWDKLVHSTLVALTGVVAAWLMLGFAHARGKHIPVQFGALFGMLIAMVIGALWEFIEFGSDYFGDANLQKSNGDTITDIIGNDLGGWLAVLVGIWFYAHVLKEQQHREMGEIAGWLAHGPRRLLHRHGRIVGAVVAVAFAFALFMSRWVDRDPVALASGLPAGESQHWDFVADPTGGTAVLSGDWVPDPERGICRLNPEHPNPGSEKPGLLQLAPGTVYGANGTPFHLQARYYEERPPIVRGSEMDGGVAFGVRDDKDFDLLEQSALHDVLRLDRYIHGKRRDLREKLYRTHGNEWHVLTVDVAGGHVSAAVDGESVFATDNVSATEGGIGLWARTAAATCFSEAEVVVGESGS
jgi:hypothetical protein